MGQCSQSYKLAADVMHVGLTSTNSQLRSPVEFHNIAVQSKYASFHHMHHALVMLENN